MDMELYNTTDKTKVIPKFNYEGKMTMKPHETVKIEDYMASFFKPYARVGIVARPIARMGTFSLNDYMEPEVEEVIKEDKKVEAVVDSKSEEAPEPVEETKDSEPVNEEPKQDNEEVKKEDKKESKKYTKDKLMSMSIKNLKILSESLGVDIGSAVKKADIVKVILDFQNNK